MSETLELAQKLLKIDSVTPNDKGCQNIIADYLKPLGFEIEPMKFGKVDNLWARLGETGKLFVFAGHTDVVPTGPVEQWKHPPFSAQIHETMLYGRGSADMKSSIACFMVACKNFLKNNPEMKNSIGFLITSDEEGPAIDGTVKVIETLEARQEKIDYCLVGEPTSDNKLGDFIKNGRRGSLHGILTVKGIQGHIAYPHLALNPIHKLAPALEQLVNVKWDDGNEYFPPTSFQISNINAGTGATNVTPGEVKVVFNFRFSTEHTAESLQNSVVSILNQHHFEFEIDWNLSGKPFITGNSGELVTASVNAVKNILGYEPKLSTSGGTSDGRFIAPTGAQVIELGPLNATIHQIDECVSVHDLENLTKIYEEILKQLV